MELTDSQPTNRPTDISCGVQWDDILLPSPPLWHQRVIIASLQSEKQEAAERVVALVVVIKSFVGREAEIDRVAFL